MSMNDFNVNMNLLGLSLVDMHISTNAQKIYLHNFTGFIDLFPKMKFFENNKKEKWLKVALKRGKIENKITECIKKLYYNSKMSTREALKKNILADDKTATAICIDPIITMYKKSLEEFEKTFPIFPKLVPRCDRREIYSSTFYKEYVPNIWDTYCRLNVLNPFEYNILEIIDKGVKEKFKFMK